MQQDSKEEIIVESPPPALVESMNMGIKQEDPSYGSVSLEENSVEEVILGRSSPDLSASPVSRQNAHNVGGFLLVSDSQPPQPVYSDDFVVSFHVDRLT